MTAADAPEQLTYPRQEALTRRFRLGAPRSFSVAPDGTRALFIRSDNGRDDAGSLWQIDASGAETCLVDARGLLSVEGDIPAAERARRERMREVTAGITAYSVDRDFTRAAFCVDGVPYSIGLNPQAAPVVLASPGPAVDPRISPDGNHVAFVHDGALFVSPADGTGEPACLASPESPTETWGLADFIAAEELERQRGLWWLPTSEAVLAELVDEADVTVQWISDPATPTAQPREHRYPAAGTANPVARLFRISVDGMRVEVTWDHDAYPYLATVDTSHDDGAVISVLSRDQTRQLVFLLPHDGSVHRVLRERVTQPWITLQAGVPRLDMGGALLEIVADIDHNTFRLVRDDEPITPAGVNVTGVVTCDAEGIVITGAWEPSEQHVLRVTGNQDPAHLTSGPSVNSAAASGNAMVIVSVDDETPGSKPEFVTPQGRQPIVNKAEVPVVVPTVAFHSSGEIDFAVILPTGHVSGTPLPVVMAPYGGPHHNRVVHARNAFTSDQWLADQGFAVVVVDGRGTPGRGPRREFAVHGDLASGVLQDQVDGLQAASGLYPDLDLTRVGITGWSFGGYLAALAVLDRPDIFHAAVAGAPVTEWRLYDTAYTERYLGMPQANPSGYDGSSLLTRATQLHRPLLLIHGTADDNVVFAHTLQLSSALLAAGRQHNVLPLSGVTHMTPQEIVAENLLLLEVDFLRTQLHAR